MSKNTKKHINQQIGDAISAAKKKLLQKSLDGADLGEAVEEFVNSLGGQLMKIAEDSPRMVRERARLIIDDPNDDEDTRQTLKSALEDNDENLAELVRRAENGETILNCTGDPEGVKESVEAKHPQHGYVSYCQSCEEEVEVMAETVMRGLSGQCDDKYELAFIQLLDKIYNEEKSYDMIAYTARNAAFAKSDELMEQGLKLIIKARLRGGAQ